MKWFITVQDGTVYDDLEKARDHINAGRELSWWAAPLHEGTAYTVHKYNVPFPGGGQATGMLLSAVGVLEFETDDVNVAIKGRNRYVRAKKIDKLVDRILYIEDEIRDVWPEYFGLKAELERLKSEDD